MRTTDFSRAPDYVQTEAMFYGATRYRLKGLLTLPYRWYKLRRTLAKDPNFVRLKIWFNFPRTIGSIVFFRDSESLQKFAREESHRQMMLWVADETIADAGFIKIFQAIPHGYANGEWAESGQMTHIKHYSKLKDESEAPLVNPDNPNDKSAKD